MVRPKKNRLISNMPDVTYFKPPGIPLRFLDEVCISFEETEAIRLKDSEGLDQTKCAEKMGISRSTFQRIIQAARQKIAEALLNGKAIRIEGGHFDIAMRRFRCRDGHEWDTKVGTAAIEVAVKCPVCGDPDVTPATDMGPSFGGGRGRWANWPKSSGESDQLSI
ncbi:DUF134 domain-containing protein [Chloroflexota bacterium]